MANELRRIEPDSSTMEFECQQKGGKVTIPMWEVKIDADGDLAMVCPECQGNHYMVLGDNEDS
jgi:hypothetical protein